MRKISLAIVLAAALVLCCAAISPAQQQDVPLAFKFAVGDVIQYDVIVSGSASVTAAGNQVTPVTVRGNLSLAQTVTQVLPDGSGRLETRMPSGDLTVVVDKEQAKFSYANGQLRWFANGKESTPPQGDLSKLPLIGAPIAYTMAPDGRVNDLGFADPRMMAEVLKAMPGFDFSSMQNTGEAIFPANPVKIGETWSTSKTLAPMGPMLPFLLTTSRTLDSFSDAGGIGLAKITGVSESRYVGAANPTALPGVMKDVSFSISDIRQSVNSTEFFNTTNGRLMRGDYDVALSAHVSANIANDQKSVGADARIRVSVQSR